MRNEQLKSITVYFQTEEFNQLSEEASDPGVRVAAYIRARLGFVVRGRGAPTGKRPRRKSSNPGTKHSGAQD
jgi:hypothetical protein